MLKHLNKKTLCLKDLVLNEMLCFLPHLSNGKSLLLTMKEHSENLEKSFTGVYLSQILICLVSRYQWTEKMLPRMAVLWLILNIRIKGGDQEGHMKPTGGLRGQGKSKEERHYFNTDGDKLVSS